MIALWTILILCGVYIFPGLAILPRSIYNSKLAYSIPILSVLIIASLGRILKFVGIFTEQTVLFATLLFVPIAMWRVLRIRKLVDFEWPPLHRIYYLMASCSAIFLAIPLGLTDFAIDDEIYSWNMWAVQHKLGLPHDLFYTKSPYPQTFPFLLSWKYHLLQSTEVHAPARASLAILSASMFAAIGVSCQRRDFYVIFWFLALIVFLITTTGLYASLIFGLAEVVMIPALVISVALYISWRSRPEDLTTLWLASLAAIVAGLSKQPALIWLFGFSLLAAIQAVRRRLSAGTFPIVLAPTSGLLWVLTEGNGFWENPNVIIAAQKGRTWSDQIFHVGENLVQNYPGFLILTLLCAYVTILNKTHRDILLIIVMPYMILFTFFGIYAIRLGIHVVALSALLVSASGYWQQKKTSVLQWEEVVTSEMKRLVCAFAIISLIGAGSMAWTRIAQLGTQHSFYDAGKNTIRMYFGKDWDKIYKKIYKGDDLLWIPSNYIYGIFYGHNSIVRPGRRESISDLGLHIIQNRPRYLFDAGHIVGTSISDTNFRALVARCSHWFDRFAGPPNRFGYIIYQLNDAAVDRDPECGQ